MANNRELSQFAAFVEVGISSIGFTTSVGIGTTNPQFDLDVVGDINLTGTLYQGGSQFISSKWDTSGSDIYRLSKVGINTSIVSSTLTVNGNTLVTGIVTASSFFGDGSALTNLPGGGGGVNIRYNNINIGTGITSLNFSGTGISSVTSNVSGISTVIVDLQSNLDGGAPDTNYGGIDAIEGGSV